MKDWFSQSCFGSTTTPGRVAAVAVSDGDVLRGNFRFLELNGIDLGFGQQPEAFSLFIANLCTGNSEQERCSLVAFFDD